MMARMLQSVGLGKEESEYNEEGHAARVFLCNERCCKKDCSYASMRGEYGRGWECGRVVGREVSVGGCGRRQAAG